MGGEWFLQFYHHPEIPFNLSAYQGLLLDLKDEYNEFGRWIIDREDAKAQAKTFQGNLMAFFEYACHHHGYKTPRVHRWYLFWNPQLVKSHQSIATLSDIHHKCSPSDFDDISIEIQLRILRAFPDHFILYRDNRHDTELLYDLKPQYLEKQEAIKYYQPVKPLRRYSFS